MKKWNKCLKKEKKNKEKNNKEKKVQVHNKIKQNKK